MTQSAENYENAPLLSENNKPKKYLILTSSGGGGHINAAQARRNELLALKIPEDQIDIIDLMGLYQGIGAKNKGQPWIPTYSFFALDPMFSGEANTSQWDNAQREGAEKAVRKLENLVELQPFAEGLQASEVEKNLYEYLQSNDVQAVYNTQALSTPAICQAVVRHNEELTEDTPKKPLSIITTVTDLITHRAEHFLTSLQKLKPEHQAVLQMEIAASPMMDPGESEAEFLKRYGVPDKLFVPKAPLGILDGEIYRGETKAGEYKLPVKQEILNYDAKDSGKILIKANKVDNDAEFQYLNSQLGRAEKQASVDIEIKKGKNDKLITITMGSQGSNTVLEYMDAFKEQIIAAKDLPDDGNIYLCIPAGKSGKGSLYEKVKDHAGNIMAELPENLKKRVKILPLAFQDGKHMASLLSNSDVLVTRSGGMSAYEAKATHGRNPSRQVFVHSEAKLKYPDNFPKHSFDATYEALMTGTVKWEGGNAEYLLREIEASLGSSETINFGFSSNKEERQNPKENSLFHFAYDKKLNKDNLTKIEQLIREGSNPNLKFPGGSYLIDHCADLETKKLLVKFGAHITKKSLEGLSEEDKNKLYLEQKEFKKSGFPTPIDGDEKQKKAYSYLNPLQPTNTLEKIIVGIDRIGNFIKNKVLMMDSIHNYLDATRMYLRTDPTEKRSPLKRARQLRNFAINTAIFVAKQPVYMVTKPISCATNIIRAGLVGAGIIYNEAKGVKSNISSYAELKATRKKILVDAKDSLVAWGTAALVFSGFGAPVAFSIGGASASISLGAASFGVANSAVAKLNAALVQTVSLTQTPAASAVMMAETVAEWGAIRPFFYHYLNPKKLFYTKNETGKEEHNLLGEKVHELHKITTDSTIDIEIRREASKKIDHMLKGINIEHIGARAAKVALVPFKEGSKKKSKEV
ncbi:MAG: hypothetical protein WBJ81_00380 [Rickettsiales bacterium]